VGVPVFLASSASAHYRLGQIVGKATEVRFTPISSAWQFSDGSSSTSSSLAHRFAAPGTYLANLTVRYSVSYRFAGQSNWTIEPGSIELTDQVQVIVNELVGSPANPAEPSDEPATGGQRPYLVGSNCLQRPSAFGCTGSQ